MAKNIGSERTESLWRLRADVVSTRALLWVAGAGRYGDPTTEVHLYLYDRYWRLARHHERLGHHRRATALRAKAEAHYRCSGHDGPPFEAALAAAPPRPPILTRAVASSRPDDDDDVA